MIAMRTFAIFILVFPGYLLADEHPACSKPGSAFIDNSADELRSIAASCKADNVARLFYNKAYHKDLLKEGKILSRLDTINDQSSYQITAYRLYIALVEELAPLYYPDLNQRIEFLNQVYERRGEVVELRIRGYDKLADALEKKLMF